MNYGLPYMGSKNFIAEWVIEQLPAAEVFVDMFAGGCAVTHAALTTRKYQHFIVNDLTDAPQLFFDAATGKYRDEDRWISREEFFMFKDADPYIRLCWSFGNRGRDYLYNKKIEPYKRALQQVVFGKTPHDRAIAFRKAIKELWKLGVILAHGNTSKGEQYLPAETMEKATRLQSLQSLERLQSLESLERLERLESLQSPENVTILQQDYREVAIPDNAVIYCDPPYKGVAKYPTGYFDHEQFYTWCEQQTQPVYISEYDMPAGRFVCIAERKHTSRLSAQRSYGVTEKIFTTPRFANRKANEQKLSKL